MCVTYVRLISYNDFVRSGKLRQRFINNLSISFLALFIKVTGHFEAVPPCICLYLLAVEPCLTPLYQAGTFDIVLSKLRLDAEVVTFGIEHPLFQSAD